jgi:ABC transporter related protein
MSYIKCKDLSVGYDGNIVSQGINFNLEAGDYLCIVGENGAGKSTLMKTLLGLIPKLSGEIEYGEDLSKSDIGYLPQQTLLQKDFPASVREIVLSGHIGKGSLHYSRIQKQIARESMEYMSISNLANKCYMDLSGGQKQRVLLARALCATSKLILLDEPVTGLDPKVTTDFYNLVKKLNDDGISIIMVSHDIDSSIKYASHILHIAEKQLFFGETKDYIDSQAYKIFGIIENSR